MASYQVLGQKDTRSGFGEGLLRLGRTNPKVLALCADLKGSLKMDAFIEEFPDRYIECGIAEANMMGVAAGLATAGYIPFAGTFAAFATGRVYDQIRQVIAYSEKNVKIAASHAPKHDGGSAVRLQSDHPSNASCSRTRGSCLPSVWSPFGTDLYSRNYALCDW